MDLAISGKTALITASTYGLGFAIAKRLVDEGCRVIINSRNQQTLNSAVEKLGSNAFGLAGDLSRADDRGNVIKSATDEFGEIDILVVNTAHPPTRPFSSATDEDF